MVWQKHNFYLSFSSFPINVDHKFWNNPQYSLSESCLKYFPPLNSTFWIQSLPSLLTNLYQTKLRYKHKWCNIFQKTDKVSGKCYYRHLSNVEHRKFGRQLYYSQFILPFASLPRMTPVCVNPLWHIRHHTTIQLCFQDYVESLSYILVVGSSCAACLEKGWFSNGLL